MFTKTLEVIAAIGFSIILGYAIIIGFVYYAATGGLDDIFSGTAGHIEQKR